MMPSTPPPVYHIPVMGQEVCRYLVTRPEGVYVDCTFGGGGHSRLILERLSDQGLLIAIDKDSHAPAENLHDPRLMFIRGDFRYLVNYLDFLEIPSVDGVLADLGVSSHQLDNPERGFSFRRTGPLDMRMSDRQEISARDLLAQVSPEELTEILREYGEIPQAKAVAARLIQYRSQSGLNTSQDVVNALAGMRLRGSEEKLLSCVFQALRIHLNSELDSLKSLLEQLPGLLNPGGRAVIIAYHSLEDRLIKHFFRTGNFEDKAYKDAFGHIQRPLEPVTPQALKPSAEEIAHNPRSRSARLRVAEKPHKV
jgi:16S rRNA (cytosine1402-N4)-methyltransferase